LAIVKNAKGNFFASVDVGVIEFNPAFQKIRPQ
jgi:hypothetical protein